MASSVLINTGSGTSAHGVTSSETGLLVASTESSFENPRTFLRNEWNQPVGFAYNIDKTARFTVSGVVNGTSGLMATSINWGADIALALFDSGAGSGRMSGVINLLESVAISESQGDWKRATLNFAVYDTLASLV